MKNTLVSIFVYIALARSSDSSTNTTESDRDYKSSSDSNPMITPIVPSPEHPCPSNEPAEVTLQHMPDSIKGCIKKIKEHEKKADKHLEKHLELVELYLDGLDIFLDYKDDLYREANSYYSRNFSFTDYLAIVESNKTTFNKAWDDFKECQKLIEVEGNVIRNIIEKAQKKFPGETSERLKQFEKIPEYLVARDSRFTAKTE